MAETVDTTDTGKLADEFKITATPVGSALDGSINGGQHLGQLFGGPPTYLIFDRLGESLMTCRKHRVVTLRLGIIRKGLFRKIGG